MAGSAWTDSLSQIKDDFGDSLLRLEHDQYIDFCYENKQLRKFAEDYLPKLGKRNKSSAKRADVAIDKKNEGNRRYLEKKFEKSLSLYTESIFHGSRNDETLPLAYSNRSLVLFQMNKYSECVQDIEMALSTGYNVNKAWKLKLRKAECLAHLGDFEKAKEILNECAQEPHDKRIFQNVSNEITKLESGKDMKVSRKVEFQFPELAGGENENFISASNYIGVYYSNKKGRHVIANNDIQVGDVLFVEKAFTFVLLKVACHYCCAKTVAPIPCWNCIEVSYCSPECRDKEWEYIHKLECGYHEALKYFGIAHLGLKILLVASPTFEIFKKVLNDVRLFEYEEGPISWATKGYESVYNLISHTEKYEPSDLFQFVMSAILLTLHMKKNTNYFPETTTDEDFKLFASTIWRHIMQMICNCYAIIDCFQYSSEGKLSITTTEERLGSAVFPSVCMLNHSCEPNVIYSFYRDYFIIRACKNIKKGEEVTSCYGAYVKFMDKFSRTQVLQGQYFIDCDCYHCSQEVDTMEKFKALKCSSCKGPVITREPLFPLFGFCLSCDRRLEIEEETLDKAKKLDDLYAEGFALMKKDVKSALMKFLASWWIAREIYYKFHEYFMISTDKIALCLCELKDFRKAARFLKCSLMAIEVRFGTFSIEVAGESSTFGDVLYNCALNCTDCDDDEKKEKAREAAKWYGKAEKIYSLLYGPYYHELDTIRGNIAKLEAFCAGDVPSSAE